MNSNWIWTNLEGSCILAEHCSPLYELVTLLIRSISFQARLKGMWAAYSYVRCARKIMKPLNGSLLNCWGFFPQKLLDFFEIKTIVCQVWHYFHQGSLPNCTKRNCMKNFIEITSAHCGTEKACLDYCLNPIPTTSTETMNLSFILCFLGIYLHWCM